jgi:Fe-S cluster biogenesis protein NfuA
MSLTEVHMNEENVKSALAEVGQALSADGGGVDLVGIEDNVVKVKLTGACAGCPMAQMTLQRVVEARLKAKVPEIEKVQAV